MILKRLAPAKINLGLHVLRKRSDGFHDLETVFLRLAWADEITYRPAPGITLTCSDAALTTDESNLVMKAARLLTDETGVETGAALHLDKHLPYGAGLGGGSSDAAATLRLLADAWDLDVSETTLHRLALALGSDVPFFLGPDAAYATGRGEILTPLLDPTTGEDYTCPFPLVVVMPDVHVSTAEAYRGVQPNDANRPDLCAVVTSNDLERWERELVNDFEPSVFAAHPSVGALKQSLLDAGAGYVSMSGSGSAVFGVFDDKAKATAAAEAARLNGLRVWHGGRSV